MSASYGRLRVGDEWHTWVAAHALIEDLEGKTIEDVRRELDAPKNDGDDEC